jgi:ABC-type Fe3+ transport system substrate-binding protein
MRAQVVIALALCAALAPGAPARAADQALIAAAKKEGEVTWYTVQIVNQLAAPVARAFEKKYGIKVNYVRANADEVLLRVVNEAKAGRIYCDLVDGDSTAPALKRARLALQWTPDVAKDFPSDRKDPEGYWIATYVSVSTPDVNTERTTPATRPKSWQDFLDPRWKNEIAWSSEDSPLAGPGFVGLVMRVLGPTMGRAYLQKLARQNIAGLPVANRQVLDQVIAGEYSLGLQISDHHAYFSAKQGAPVAWLPVGPAMVTAITASVIKGAPHPNAAKLLLDFLVSKEGQMIYKEAGYLPANPEVSPKDSALLPNGGDFRGIFYSPEEIEKELPSWVALYNEYFR